MDRLRSTLGAAVRALLARRHDAVRRGQSCPHHYADGGLLDSECLDGGVRPVRAVGHDPVHVSCRLELHAALPHAASWAARLLGERRVAALLGDHRGRHPDCSAVPVRPRACSRTAHPGCRVPGSVDSDHDGLRHGRLRRLASGGASRAVSPVLSRRHGRLYRRWHEDDSSAAGAETRLDRGAKAATPTSRATAKGWGQNGA